MDSTIDVAFDTALVIAMEVPVVKAAHCSPYHSDSSLSRECVGSLTDRTKLTRDTNYRVRVPRRGDIAKNPVISGRLSIYRACETNYRAPAWGENVPACTLIRLQKFMPKSQR